MGKKSKPPKAPDLTPISNAQIQIAQESNELAREYLGLSREQYAWMQENAKEELALAREQANKLWEYQDKAFKSDEEAKAFARQVGQSQIDAMNLQMDYAKRDRQRYEQVFLPMQDRYIREANEYDTPQRREAEASRAMVDIQRQAEAARSNSDQRLRSMGIDPSQMRSQSLLQAQDVAMAAQQAGAANMARQGVEDRGRAMRADAINVGAGLPAQALAGFQGAGNSGQGALGAGMAGQQAQLGAIQGGAGVGGTALGFRSNALNNVSSLTGSPMQWAGLGGNMMGQASNAYGNAGNMLSQNFQNQMSRWQAGQQQSQQGLSNIMSVAGMAAGAMMLAEGGEVRRPEKGQAIEREQFPLARSVIEGDFTRLPKGQMRGVRPNTITAGDRIKGALGGMSQFNAPNLFDEQYTPPQMLVQQAQLPPVMAAEGGSVPQRARGALPVKQSRDAIPAFLSEGEYVLPADVVRAMGIEKLDKLVAKYHRDNS